MSVSVSRPALREVLRQETRSRIADAALDLAEERGSTELRAGEIAARAGISRRTFFNHVGSTSAVFSIPVEDYLDDARRNFLTRPPGEGIIASMIAVLDEIDPVVAVRFERMLRLSALAGSILSAGLDAWDRCEQEVRQAIAERLPSDTDPLFLATLSAAVMGAGRSAAVAWAAGGPVAGRTRRALVADMARALRYLTSIEDAWSPGAEP